ncbi:MAG: thermopsin family protease [Thermoplasmata archaeon]
MTDRRAVLLGAALVTVIMALSSMGLVSAYQAHSVLVGDQSAPAATPPGHSLPARPTGSGPFAIPSERDSGAPIVPSSGAGSSDPNLPYGIAQAEREIASHQVNPASVLLPRAPTGAVHAPNGPITGPSYPSLPAPMGLADLGQSGSGPYEYNTSSFVASLNVTSFQDYNPGYSGWGAAPNWMTFQLNTVTVNTSYPGAANGSFWIQNVVHFNGTSLQFEDNIWNFSSPAACLGAGTLLNYSGSQDGCFYYVYGPTYQITYPFALSLYNNVTISNWGPTPVPDVFFNYSLSFGSSYYQGAFDNVTFNGTASSSAPPLFEVNGFNYNPLGYLFYDAEIILGGNGGGANAVIAQLAASANLDFWNATNLSYSTVPAAYDYGEDTGETSIGVAASWILGPTELLNQGPSMLYGLWGTTNSSFGPAAQNGQFDLSVSGLPIYSFGFATNATSWDTTGTLNDSYWPAAVDGTMLTALPPPYAGDGYVLDAFANGYDPKEVSLPSGGGATVVSLTRDATNFDTPVYLSTDAQVTSFGTSGVPGVAYSDYGDLWINNTQSAVASPFNLVNDFLFPSFVLFAALNLTDNVTVDHFSIASSSSTYYGSRGSFTSPGWSQGYYFNFGSGIFNVTNVTVPGNSTLYYVDQSYPLGAVEFWSTTGGESASNVVTAGDVFGVDDFYSNDVSLVNITSETGANAAYVQDADGVYAAFVTANGTDLNNVPSYGVILDGVDDAYIYATNATNGGLGIYMEYVEGFYILGLNVTGGSIGLEMIQAGYGDIDNLYVNSSYGVYADAWYYVGTDHWTFTNGATAGELYYGSADEVLYNVTVSDSTGLYLWVAANLSAYFVTATGPGTIGLEVVDGFDTFYSNLSASDQAIGVATEGEEGFYTTNVTAENITSTMGALGFGVVDGVNINVTNVSASDKGLGALVESSENATVENATTTNVGVAVGVIDDDDVYVLNVNSTSAVPGPEYFTGTVFNNVPNAAVVVMNTGFISVIGVTAYNSGYGVYINGSGYLYVDHLASWNAQVGIQYNGGGYADLDQAFLFGSQVGVDLTNTTQVYLEANTVEASVGYGISITYSSNDTVAANNFVANNGASTDGTFSSAHVQANVMASSDIWFNYSAGAGNYWSDWSSGVYAIAPGFADNSPVAAFLTNWLEFDETGLPAGTVWGFTLDTISYTTSAPLVFIPSWSLGDPTLGYVVNAPFGYTPTPGSGTLPYTGTNVTVTISFVPTPYTVTFDETGLVAGTSWSVTFDGATQSGIPTSFVFHTIDGTYSYSIGAIAGYTITPNGGSVTVSGSDLTVDITFAPVTYPVTFLESGLSPGTSWSVTLGTSTLTSTTSSIQFSAPNGTDSFEITAVAGYTANVTHGTVFVNAAATSVSILFTAVIPVTYSVTFTETGLTSGSWSVTLAGNTETEAAGTAIVFTGLSNNTYTYTIGAVSGYTSSPTSSAVIVDGNSPTVQVAFSAVTTTSPGPSGSSGLTTLDWGIIGLVIVLIIVGLLLALARRGRGGDASSAGTNSSPVKPWEESSSGNAPQDPSEDM